jgi:hypothetical protein
MNTKGTIRFVPADFDMRPAKPPSSTELRKVIKTCSSKSLVDELKKNYALDPEVLATFVVRSQM